MFAKFTADHIMDQCVLALVLLPWENSDRVVPEWFFRWFGFLFSGHATWHITNCPHSEEYQAMELPHVYGHWNREAARKKLEHEKWWREKHEGR